MATNRDDKLTIETLEMVLTECVRATGEQLPYGDLPGHIMELIAAVRKAESQRDDFKRQLTAEREGRMLAERIVDEVRARNRELTGAAREYLKKNPLGGPAKVFEMMASRIRAGEDYHDVLKDYGLQHIPESAA